MQKMRRLGSLNCIDLVKDYDGPWIVLFHGFGASANDLFPLAHEIQVPANYNWLFPEGFLEIQIGWNATGRAWWPVNIEELQKIQQTQKNKDLSDSEPEGLKLAFQKTFDMLEKLKVPWNKIILGGFSQGAMLATELYLQAPESPLGLVIFSGACLKSENWKEKSKNRAGKTFFISHGEQDPVLSIKGSQKLETILTQSGMKGKILRFQGGHEIPWRVIEEAGKYISGLSLK